MPLYTEQPTPRLPYRDPSIITASISSQVYHYAVFEKIVSEISIEAQKKQSNIEPYLAQLKKLVVSIYEENDTGTDDAINQGVEILWAKILDLILAGKLDPYDIPNELRYNKKIPNFLGKLTVAIGSAGNAPIAKVVRNIIAIKSLLGANFAIKKGASLGFGKTHTDEGMSAHGKSGLGDYKDSDLDELAKKSVLDESSTHSAAYKVLADELEYGYRSFVYSATAPATTFALAVLELDFRMRSRTRRDDKYTDVVKEVLSFQNKFSAQIEKKDISKEEAASINQAMSKEKETLGPNTQDVLSGKIRLIEILAPETLLQIQLQVNRGVFRGIEVVGGVLPEPVGKILVECEYRPRCLIREGKSEMQAALAAGKITQNTYDLIYGYKWSGDPEEITRQVFGNSGPRTKTISFNFFMDPIASIFLFDLSRELATRFNTRLPVVDINAILSNRVIIATDIFKKALEEEKVFKKQYGIPLEKKSVLDFFNVIFSKAQYGHRIPTFIGPNGEKVDYNLVHDVFTSMARVYPDLFQYKQVNVEFDNPKDSEYRPGLLGLMGLNSYTDPRIPHYLLDIPLENRERFEQLLAANIIYLSKLRLCEEHSIDLSAVFPKRQKSSGVDGAAERP